MCIRDRAYALQALITQGDTPGAPTSDEASADEATDTDNKEEE